jgi:hypothetical protein
MPYLFFLNFSSHASEIPRNIFHLYNMWEYHLSKILKKHYLVFLSPFLLAKTNGMDCCVPRYFSTLAPSFILYLFVILSSFLGNFSFCIFPSFVTWYVLLLVIIFIDKDGVSIFVYPCSSRAYFISHSSPPIKP